jgi:hypothetical protein
MVAQFKKGAENLTPGEIHLAGWGILELFDEKICMPKLAGKQAAARAPPGAPTTTPPPGRPTSTRQ